MRNNDEQSTTKEIRIFMDGAFDLMHYGHMNAFRLARSLGTYLIVGVNSDTSITECKGPPLLNDDERLRMVQSCKFVDEVLPNCPYIMDADYVQWVIDTYQIDYVVHGDDPCIVNGKDVYEAAKAAGRYRSIPRTHGVSTTDIIGRILLLPMNDEDSDNCESRLNAKPSENFVDHPTIDSTTKSTLLSSSATKLLCQRSNFLTTTRMIQLFSICGTINNTVKKVSKRVYIDGAWDLFHPGHVAILEMARKRGDYLIVGIYNDQVVNEIYGRNLPFLNLHERTLSVLGCRYVDDVLIDAPYSITRDMITTLGIDEIVFFEPLRNEHSLYIDKVNDPSRFQVAIDAGILQNVSVDVFFQIENVLDRIQQNLQQFQAKYDRKMIAEQEYMLSITKETETSKKE